MDTKSKKSKPLAAWLCFFLGISMLIWLAVMGLAIWAHGDGEILSGPFGKDYQDTVTFEKTTASYFDRLLSLAATDSYSESYLEQIKNTLDAEGDNLIYYAVNEHTGLKLKNIEDTDLLPSPQAKVKYEIQLGDADTRPEPAPAEQRLTLPEGYNYYWYFDGQKIWLIDHDQTVNFTKLGSSDYRSIDNDLNHWEGWDKIYLQGVRVVLAVNDTITSNPYGHSCYYEEKQIQEWFGRVYMALFLLAIALLVYTITRYRDKRAGDRKLAKWLSPLWLEVKIILSLLMLYLLAAALSGGSILMQGILNMAIIICAILIVFWWFYIMVADLAVNRKEFFTHNSINSFLNWYRLYEMKYPWQKAMLKRAYLLVALEIFLGVLAVIFLLIAVFASSVAAMLAALVLTGTGIYFIFRYLKIYQRGLNDMGKLMDHIALIKNGDMETRLEIAEDGDIYPAASNLNSIQEGMKIAVAEKMKSERMKMELITNVSHDLKTPLTSIISYVELLEKEEGLPEEVNDYIKILAQKSERLKNLIQDLFDLSKASSENIRLDMEKIDLVRLVQQVMGDMEEPINESGLSFRLNLPDRPVYIMSDGKKLYRVWENLVTNALKYSLTGSRVFIDLVADNGGVVATIKNTSNYEMNFTEEEILQRFARGDESRSTEGSGLGLSIAQSFTHICGGEFAIKIDGDLFKVELRFTEL